MQSRAKLVELFTRLGSTGKLALWFSPSWCKSPLLLWVQQTQLQEITRTFVLSGLLRKDFIGTNRAFLALLCPPLCSGGETDLHRQTAFTLPLDLALLCPPLCSGGETDLHRRTFALPPAHNRFSGWTHSDFHALFLFSNAALIQLFCIRSICLSANIF